MGEKKYAKGPLLYIHQPTTRAPEASMQQNYKTPRKKSGQSTPEQQAKQAKTAPTRPMKRKNSSNKSKNENVTEIVEDEVETEMVDDTSEETDENSNRQARRKFKDMTLQERVDYFVSLPKHAPAMRCEVKTDERNYQGFINDFHEGNVFMRAGRRLSPMEIPFDTINDIRLIGF